MLCSSLGIEIYFLSWHSFQFQIHTLMFHYFPRVDTTQFCSLAHLGCILKAGTSQCFNKTQGNNSKASQYDKIMLFLQKKTPKIEAIISSLMNFFHRLFFKKIVKRIAPGEARTHGLQIMRLTRCLLRYRGMVKKMLFLPFRRFV